MPNDHPLYDDDLAFIHDAYFSGLSESWAPGLLALLRDSGLDHGTVVDLGCGGGGWIGHLVDAGYHVVGLDVSAAMVDLAQKRVPTAELHVGSVWDYPLPRCGAVTALSEVVCYRTDASPSPDLEALFRRIFAALEAGGLLIFDVTEVGLDRDRDPTFTQGDDWSCLVRFEYDPRRSRLHRHITAYRKVGSLFRRTDEEHCVQLYDGEHVLAILARTGFEARLVRAFGSAPLLPQRVGFIAHKPAGASNDSFQSG